MQTDLIAKKRDKKFCIIWSNTADNIKIVFALSTKIIVFYM